MDVKTLCLGVLAFGDASGYEIKKQLEEGPLAHFYRAGFGSIYPALGKLSEEGLVTCTETAQEGRPGKKTYSLTSAGREAFTRALRKKPAEDRIRSESLFMLFFGNFLETARRREIYEEYLAQYQQTVAYMQTVDLCGTEPCRQFVHGFGLSLYQAIITFMDENRHLICEDDTQAVALRRGDDEALERTRP